jgi:hypothetical protein
MAMPFATTGQEREVSQFRALLTAAQLRQTRVADLPQPYHLLEAVAG